MLYLLTIFLILFAILSYYSSKRNVISPTFILSVLFLVTIIFSIVGNRQWKVSINPKLILVFFVGMFALYLGELIVLGTINNKLTVRNTENINERIDIPFERLIIIIVIDVIILLLYINRLIEVASSIGYSGSMLLQYVRWATVSYGIRLGNFYTIFLGFITGSSFVCIYIIAYNTLIAKIKLISSKNLVYFIPIIIQITQVLFSGARDGLIKTLVVIFACSLILYQDKMKKIKLGRIIVIGSIGLFVFLIVFTTLGELRGNAISDNFTEQIFVYVGSSVVALSLWLDNGLIGFNKVFAGESFWGIRHLLSIFFPSVAEQSKFLEFTYFPDGSRTNIYTAFRSYLYDFGWGGLFLIMLLIGIVFNVIYFIVKKRQNPFLTIVYSYYLFNFIYTLFTPSITSSLFTTTQIFDVFWIYIIYRFTFKYRIKFKLGTKKIVLNKIQDYN